MLVENPPFERAHKHRLDKEELAERLWNLIKLVTLCATKGASFIKGHVVLFQTNYMSQKLIKKLSSSKLLNRSQLFVLIEHTLWLYQHTWAKHSKEGSNSPDIPDPFFDLQVNLSHWGCEGVCGLPLFFQANFRESLYLKIGYLDIKVKSHSLLDEGLCKRSQVNSFFKATEIFCAFCSHLSLNWAGNILHLEKYTVWLLYAIPSASLNLYSSLLAIRLYITLIFMSMRIISAVGFAEQNIWILLVLL